MTGGRIARDQRSPEPHVLVVGGLNTDTLARVSVHPALHFTSNPGRAETMSGGVGRNVAENLARLGSRVRLVGVVGDDARGDQLLEELDALEIDATGVRRGEEPTGTYTAVLDHLGELVIGVADMAATESLRPEHLPDDLIDGADWLVLDGNLLPATIARAVELANAAGVPVALDPVGVAKAARIGTLTGVHTFTPNVDELAAWAGRPGIESGTGRVLEEGVEVLWLREGASGSRVYVAGQPPVKIRAKGAVVVDVTGAGDAMLAAYVHHMRTSSDPVEAAWYGAAAGRLTVGSPWPVAQELSARRLELVREELRTL